METALYNKVSSEEKFFRKNCGNPLHLGWEHDKIICTVKNRGRLRLRRGSVIASKTNHQCKEVSQMPNIKSAKKRVKVIATKTLRNKSLNSNLKTTIKKAEAALAGSSDDRTAAVTLAIKKIDQAAAKGLLHKNTAARRKSRLVRKLNAAG